MGVLYIDNTGYELSLFELHTCRKSYGHSVHLMTLYELVHIMTKEVA